MSPLRTRTDFLEEIEVVATRIKQAEREARRERRRRDGLFLRAQKTGATRQEMADAAMISLAAVKFVLGGKRNKENR